MTRRKFIRKLMKAGLAVAVGASWLARKAAPRKFVRAARAKEYPGPLKALQDICRQSNWSG